jgi:hypothetical protein
MKTLTKHDIDINFIGIWAVNGLPIDRALDIIQDNSKILFRIRGQVRHNIADKTFVHFPIFNTLLFSVIEHQ